jgi:hypothetical protein
VIVRPKHLNELIIEASYVGEALAPLLAAPLVTLASKETETTRIRPCTRTIGSACFVKPSKHLQAPLEQSLSATLLATILTTLGGMRRHGKLLDVEAEPWPRF